MRYIKNLLFLSLFCLWNLHGASIIFDLGNVLIKTNTLATLWHTGPKQWILYFSKLHSPHKIRSNVYTFLQTLTKNSEENQSNVCDERGEKLPPIMCDWLAGKYSSNQLLEMVDKALETYSVSNTQKRLIKNITHAMFDPHLFIKTQSFITEGIQLIKDCKNKGHSVYLLSNWSKESYELMQQMYPEFFDLFDGKIISGEVGYNKPDPRIYQHLLATYNLDPKDCFFIDDQQTNVKAACSLNINGIVCPQNRGVLFTTPDFNSVREELDHLLR